MQLAYFFAFLLIVPYVCCTLGDFGKSLTNTKTGTGSKKDTCPTYSCLKSIGDGCITKLKEKTPPVIVSNDCLCEIVIDATKEGELTEKELATFQKDYLPFICCLLETLGIVKCDLNSETGELKGMEPGNIADLPATLGQKCVSLTGIFEGGLPGGELSNQNFLGNLTKELTTLVSSCEKCETNADLQSCSGKLLKAFNAACDKEPKDTFCPGKTDTHAQ